jgi:hypothetical protein
MPHATATARRRDAAGGRGIARRCRRRARPGGGADRNRSRLRGGACRAARRRAAGRASGTGHPAGLRGRARAAVAASGRTSIRSSPRPAADCCCTPTAPVGTARAGMIVADVTPAVAREAQALRAQLEELALCAPCRTRALDATVGRAWPGVQDGALPRCRRPSPTAATCRRRFAQMPRPCRRSCTARGRSTPSPRPAVNSRRARPTTCPISPRARGSCSLPSLGTVLREFGEADAAGVTPRPGACDPAQRTGHRALARLRALSPARCSITEMSLSSSRRRLSVWSLRDWRPCSFEAGELLTDGAPVGLMPGSGRHDGEELILPESQMQGVLSSPKRFIWN